MIHAQEGGDVPVDALIDISQQMRPEHADRVLSMVERSLEARLETERMLVRAQIAWGLRGQWIAAIVAFGALLVSAYLVVNGRDLTGFTIGGGSTFILVRLFLLGERAGEPPDDDDDDEPSASP